MTKQTLTGGKDYVKWEQVGQVIEGALVKIELSRSSRGGKMAHLADRDGVPFIISAPTLLAEVLEENFDRLEGRWLTITFSGQDKPSRKSESGLMRFTVDWDDAEAKEGDESGRPRGRT